MAGRWSTADESADKTRQVAASNTPRLRFFIFGLFFVFGGITSLNDVIIPKLKELFTLSYTQAMLVQFCFFTAYAVMGIPAARLVRKIGYMRGAAAGLSIMLIGCLLFVPASLMAAYELFLFALFVLASGVVVVQVVANPLVSMLGNPETVHSRLTFAQGFNALGTTIFPFFGSLLILGEIADTRASGLAGAELQAYRAAESQAIVNGYIGLAGALLIAALFIWYLRNDLKGEVHADNRSGGALDLLKRPRFGFGALAIFLYVGAEVTIGSIIVNYLQQDSVMGIAEQAAGKLIGLYWGGAMVGRFIGAALMRAVSPGKLLSCAAVGAVILIAVSSVTSGAISGYSLLAVGLANSIMFPTIFGLSCEGLGSRTADGSGLLNVAIFGGAVVPLGAGALADLTGSISVALALPAACYGVIAAFGYYASRPHIGGLAGTKEKERQNA